MLTASDKQWINKTFDQKFDEKFEEKFEEFRQYNWNMIATFKDEVLSVLHPLPEDHIVLGQHVSEHTDSIEQHEVRLTLLEKSKKSHQVN